MKKQTTTEAQNVFDREKFMLAQSIIGTIRATNAPFCCGDGEKDEAINKDVNYLDDVATMIANECSIFQIEDLISILDRALEQKIKEKEHKLRIV